jgi:hypothetical protein
MTDLDSYFLRLEWEYEDQQEEQEKPYYWFEPGQELTEQEEQELIYQEEMEYMASEYLLHSQEL